MTTTSYKSYPQSASQNALQGLAYRKQYGRGGTAVGITRAHQLAGRKPLSISTLKRMYSFFKRHEVDKKSPKWDKPSNGKIAWLLWGGDSAYLWVGKMRNKLIAKGLWQSF